MLTADDLAYMRETQAEHRPTAADLSTRTTVPDGMGGTTASWSDPVPVMVRIDGQPDQVPVNVAERLEGGTAYKVSMDLVDVRAGDRLTVSATEAYEAVSDGDPDRWATAQVVWFRRTAFPAR